MTTQLKEAAEAFKKAPVDLRDAILKAADDGDTSVEIAQAIGFVYSPDYVRKLIRQYRGKRQGGRRPRKRTNDA